MVWYLTQSAKMENQHLVFLDPANVSDIASLSLLVLEYFEMPSTASGSVKAYLQDIQLCFSTSAHTDWKKLVLKRAKALNIRDSSWVVGGKKLATDSHLLDHTQMI